MSHPVYNSSRLKLELVHAHKQDKNSFHSCCTGTGLTCQEQIASSRAIATLCSEAQARHFTANTQRPLSLFLATPGGVAFYNLK